MRPTADRDPLFNLRASWLWSAAMGAKLSALLARGGLTALGLMPDSVIRALGGIFYSRSEARFLAAARNPRKAQLDRLFSILRRAQGTVFGREHAFSEVRTLGDYRRHVPIRGWETFEPYVERMLAGESGVLVDDRPMLYARSSGTTGTPKHVPVTEAFLEEYSRPRRVFALSVLRAFPGLVRGKILSVHSPRVEARASDGTPCGSITLAFGAADGTDQRLGDGADSPLDAVPKSLFLIDDYALRYYAMLRLALQEKVSIAAAVNPSTLVMIGRKLDAFGDALASELRAGTMGGLERIPAPIRSDIERRLRKVPRVAERIEVARRSRGRVIPTDVWPEMVGLLSWKGGSAPFWLEKLASLYPGRPIMDYGYVATEGGFSIPLSPDQRGGVVSVLGHFLEFVPEEELARGDASGVCLADELEIGRRYRVLVTGSHGLYRYDINDVVECTGYFGNTSEIAFVHKGGNMLSMTGEKLGESHVVEAAARAEAATGLRLSGLCLAPELADPPRYVVALEASSPLGSEDRERFLSCFEASLRAVNIEYAQKRESERLGPLELRVLPEGAFERDRVRRVRAGAPDSHVKPLHLARDLSRLGELEGCS